MTNPDQVSNAFAQAVEALLPPVRLNGAILDPCVIARRFVTVPLVIDSL
jgi:hypothetical protein